ncbi:helix-turn-helix domain-containing protein [Sunxiuqinia indica]|uniref:helix-turn-helix domain-containing protein n=1 Tax=Sunxiuqinia indica TaxID=2692584 RepID=UPI00135C4620|nr:AraC family transcriptional regulator [Sunxiuqinia indica]
MIPVEYPPITPQVVYSGLADITAPEGNRVLTVTLENKPSGNSYMDLFANLVRQHGKHPVSFYARTLGVNTRHFDGAIRCMSGMSAHDWINEYLRQVVCDLLGDTTLSFKEIGRILGLSQSSFTQFFQAHQKMQPYQFRSIKQHNRNRGYHFA